MKKIKIALILIITMLLTCVITTKTKQTKAAENPSLSIVSYNISYSEYIYLTVAVGTNNVDYNNNTVKLLFWNQTQSEYTINNADYISLTEGLATVKGQKCLVYYSNGIAAKKMADDIILRAYVNIDGTEYYSDVITYSVVQYVKDKIASGSYSPEQYNLWTAMLEYGACAQVLFNYNTGNLANSQITTKKMMANNSTIMNLTTDTQTEPNLDIVSYNISYSDYTYLSVAVGANNIDYNSYNVKLLFWNQTQSEYTIDNAEYVSLTKGLATVKGQKCLVYFSNGIPAKKMADDIILRAYVNIDGTEYYSDVVTYNVVQYVEDRINSKDYSQAQSNLYAAMINYGTCAQILFDYGTTNLANAKFASIKVEEGTCANGLTKDYLIKGQTVTITPNEDTNKEFAYWVDENDNIVSYDQEYTFTLNEDKTYKAVYRHIINLTLNTVTYEVASTDNMTWYTPTAKGTSDLLYINITVTINDENYQNSLYTLIINGNKINSSKVNIANNVLTYQMEDPNWSDFI